MGTTAHDPDGKRSLPRSWAQILWIVAALAVIFPLAAYIAMSRRSHIDVVPRAIEPVQHEAIRAMMAKLQPLSEKIREPGPHDWLANHKEPGQTFDQYLQCEPVTLRGERRVLYIQPLGDFGPTQRKIITLTAEFMGLYFNTAVKVCDDLPLSLIPEIHRRADRGFGPQIRSTYVLDDVLKPRLPKDAAALIAFTSSDLFPEDSWNFVFGQASLYERVGVWSLARYGDPDKSAGARRLCLLRTIKTATHETGHMFSMYHCILYECNMDGSNNMRESDEKPLSLCHECQAKLCFATGADPMDQFKKLGAFCKEHDLAAEAAFYEKALGALTKP